MESSPTSTSSALASVSSGAAGFSPPSDEAASDLEAQPHPAFGEGIVQQMKGKRVSPRFCSEPHRHRALFFESNHVPVYPLPCDGCKRSIKPGLRYWSCESCIYTECIKCHWDFVRSENPDLRHDDFKEESPYELRRMMRQQVNNVAHRFWRKERVCCGTISIYDEEALVPEGMPLEIVEFVVRIEACLNVLNDHFDNDRQRAVRVAVEVFDPAQFYQVSSFSESDVKYLWMVLVCIPVVVMGTIVTIARLLIAIEKCLLLLSSVAIITMHAADTTSGDHTKIRSDVMTATAILAVVQSLIIIIAQIFTLGGLDRLDAPTIPIASNYLRVMFRTTDSKANEMRRLMGRSYLGSDERKILDRAIVEADVYLHQITKFMFWFEYLRHRQDTGPENLRALEVIRSQLTQGRVTISKWDIIEALDWGRQGCTRKHSSLLFVLNGGSSGDFIKLVANPVDLSSIILNENLGSVVILKRMSEAVTDYRERQSESTGATQTSLVN